VTMQAGTAVSPVPVTVLFVVQVLHCSSTCIPKGLVCLHAGRVLPTLSQVFTGVGRCSVECGVCFYLSRGRVGSVRLLIMVCVF
jgi:hypothetical protein